MDLEISPVSEKGQVVIPSSIRKKLNISSKDQIIWFSEDDVIKVQKLNKKLIASATFDQEWEPLRNALKRTGFGRSDLAREIAAARKNEKVRS